MVIPRHTGKRLTIAAKQKLDGVFNAGYRRYPSDAKGKKKLPVEGECGYTALVKVLKELKREWPEANRMTWAKAQFKKWLAKKFKAVRTRPAANVVAAGGPELLFEIRGERGERLANLTVPLNELRQQ